MAKPAKPLCSCGGAWVHHTNDIEGCWCEKCLRRGSERCQAYDPVVEAHARRSDPQTSHDAARSVTPKVRSDQQAVLNALHMFGPMTDEEIYAKVSVARRISDSGCRTRRAELVILGSVRNTGEKKLTKNGYKTIVWEACDGQEVMG